MRGKGENRQNFSNRDRNRSYSRDTQRQNFRPNYRGQSQNRHVQYGNDHRRGSYRCQKIIIEMTVEIEGDKTLDVLAMIEVDQGKEA